MTWCPVSFTGSEAVGQKVAKVVQGRFGKVLLELGGNNGKCGHAHFSAHTNELSYPAAVIMPDADLSLAVPAVFFGAVGTAGQRCTSTRRLYLHRSIAPSFLSRLQSLYKSVTPGDPLVSSTLLGPLHTRNAVGIYSNAIDRLRSAGAEILCGASAYSASELARELHGGNWVKPTVAVPTKVDLENDIWRTETFAPVLCVGVFDELEEAIEWNNGVPQGLSSSLWTRDIRNVGKWIGPAGSDAGIVNVRAAVVPSLASSDCDTGERWYQWC